MDMIKEKQLKIMIKDLYWLLKKAKLYFFPVIQPTLQRDHSFAISASFAIKQSLIKWF